MTPRALVAALVALVITFCAARGRAHAGRTATLRVEARSETEARLVLGRPLRLAAEGCAIAPETGPIRELRCPKGLAESSLEVLDLGRDLDLVFVRFDGADPAGRVAEDGAVVTAASPRIPLPGRAHRSAIALRYVRLGIEHVLGGADHVLFLMALFWQAWTAFGRKRELLAELARTATAFTVAHSLTLGATILRVVHVPASVAEVCIAVSLVLLALDVGREQRSSRATRAALAFAFGLVHGLGFAGALAATRLPEHAAILGLLSFNVGVELGQIFVFAIGVALLSFRGGVAPVPNASRFTAGVRTLSAYVVGSAGVFFLLLRASALFRG